MSEIDDSDVFSSKLYTKIVDLLNIYMSSTQDRTKKVIDFQSPDTIRQRFADSKIDIDLQGECQPLSEEQLVEACEKVLQLSVRTGHPLFFNQLTGRVDPTACAAENVASVCNLPVHSFSIAPVFTTIEEIMIRKLLSVVGFPEDGEGLFVPGGSIANVYGLHVARYSICPRIKTEGLSALSSELVAFVSADSHYSYEKGVHLLGMGTKHLVKIPVDPTNGGMDVGQLEIAALQAFSAGKRPFFVGATAGTTIYGGFDPLPALRAVCDKYDMWLHMDGAWGGSCVLGEKGSAIREKVDGIEYCDSLAWNPHKMMGTPMQCSVFLFRGKPGRSESFLKECNGILSADSLSADTHNIGDWSIQCSRRADAFKLWMQWLSIGDLGMTKRLHRAAALTNYFTYCLRTPAEMFAEGEEPLKGRFCLWRDQDPFFTNVCFWYIPEDFDTVFGQDLVAPWKLEDGHPAALTLRKVAPIVKNQFQVEGSSLVGFCGIHNFFRWVIASPIGSTEGDVRRLLRRIMEIAQHLTVEELSR